MKGKPMKELRRQVDDRMASFTGNRHAFGWQDHARALNEALELVASHCFIHDPTVRLTLTSGMQTVDLQDPELVTRRVIRPLQLRVAGQDRGDIVARTDLEREAPNWRSAPEGRPYLAAWSGGRHLTFDRPVDAETAAAGITISAYIIPAVIGSDGAALPMGFPTELETIGDTWSDNAGAIGSVRYTTTSGSCATASGNPNDLGAADNTAITARYPTPDCTDAIE
jgi:hypothetical protein